MRVYVVLAAAIVLNALANVTIKAGMLRVDKTAPMFEMMQKAVFSPAILLGVVLFGLALVAYSFVLSKINLSIAYPVMTSMGFLIVITVSALFFKETITPLQMAGFALILAGVWLVAR